jgi:uncharacterized protein
LAVSAATRVRRLPDRQRTDRAMLEEILDAALVAHVAYVRDGTPVVLPFACARDGDWLLLHGSTGAGLLRACTTGQPISAAVTHIDALVVARSTFDNSMNYRSAVVFGVAEVLTGTEHERALQVIVDHLLPGRWDEVRPSTRKEFAATSVLRLPLDEVSVKVRAAGPSVSEDDGEDRGAWAGLVPLRTAIGDPIPDGSVPPDQTVPASVERARRRFGGSGGRAAKPAE